MSNLTMCPQGFYSGVSVLPSETAETLSTLSDLQRSEDRTHVPLCLLQAKLQVFLPDMGQSPS